MSDQYQPNEQPFAVQGCCLPLDVAAADADDNLRWRQHLPPTVRDRYLDPDAEDGVEALLDWFRVVVGVAMAGAVYGLPFFIIGAIFGFFIAGAISCLLVLPFAICVRTTAGKWRHPLAGPAFGGVVGFLSTAEIWDGAVQFFDGAEFGGVIVFVLGPMVTTLLGQVGGYLANRRYARAALAQSYRQGAQQWRFSVRGLIVATAWVAVAVTALRGFRLLEPPHLFAIGVWLPWQLGLLQGWAWLNAPSSG